MKLKKGAVYRVRARNFFVAIWTGEAFRGPGRFNGQLILVDERPWEEGLPYGTAEAIERISPETMREPFVGANLTIALDIANELAHELYMKDEEA